MREDDWHCYSEKKTTELLARHLSVSEVPSNWLLNAGAGVYQFRLGGWKEVSLDLFTSPIRQRQCPVCASIEKLPFRSGTFGGIACVGEVLGYCDPAAAIVEFSRLLAPLGILICDFGSSREIRYWLRPPYGRAADLVTDYYNEAPERIWVYDPIYVSSLLVSSGFDIRARLGTHTWSALARRVGASAPMAVFLQRHLEWLRLPSAWADVTTIVAARA
jgi:SAM-dependent methyltransferase